ncbi:MAG: hypothetical protein ACRDRZ_10535 [Pseudonocardiaceae bacterium]
MVLFIVAVVVTAAAPPEWRVELLGAWVGWLGLHVVLCVAYPWTSCDWCAGDPRRLQPLGWLFGRGWRLCRHCDGGGRRLRLGRRVWDAVHRRGSVG